MQFDTKDLQIFSAAAELGSLTAASQQCHLALAAVSKRVVRLEEQVGSALFIREKSGVTLTPAGKVFFRYAQNWLYDVQTLNTELQEHARGFRGMVRLVVNTTAMLGFIPECIGTFLNQHRYVDVRIEEALSSEVIKRVAERRADIGICAEPIDAVNLELFPFREDHLMVVMSPQHHLATHKSLFFEQVLDEDFIALDNQAAIQLFLQTQAQRLGKTLHIRVQARSFDAICRFAQHGFGVGIVPQSSINYLIEQGQELNVIPLQDDWAQRHLQIAVRSFENLPSYAKLLVQHLGNKNK